MAPPMVRRLRWIAYAQALAPSATEDVEGRQRDIEEAVFELGDPDVQKRKLRKHSQVNAARLALADLVKARDTVRASLWPEDEEEAAALEE